MLVNNERSLISIYSGYCSAMSCISRPKQPLGWGSTMPSSPHEFFKILLLSSDYRPSVDRPSTERWPITDRYIGEVSTNYRRSVREVSVNERLYRPRHIWNDYRSCLDRVSSHYRPSLDRLSTAISTESRPTIDRLSTECRPTIDRVSTDYRPLYRPIDRSTLPTVNMILYLVYCRNLLTSRRKWYQTSQVIFLS